MESIAGIPLPVPLLTATWVQKHGARLQGDVHATDKVGHAWFHEARYALAGVDRTALPVVMLRHRFARSHPRRPYSADDSRAAPLARQREQAGTAPLSNAWCRPPHRAGGFVDVARRPRPTADTRALTGGPIWKNPRPFHPRPVATPASGLELCVALERRMLKSSGTRGSLRRRAAVEPKSLRLSRSSAAA
jgi:hypothetical protein